MLPYKLCEEWWGPCGRKLVLTIPLLNNFTIEQLNNIRGKIFINFTDEYKNARQIRDKENVYFILSLPDTAKIDRSIIKEINDGTFDPM